MNLEKSLSELLRKGKLKKQDADIHFLNDLLLAARRNFEAAALVRGKIDEASFKLVYDGLLQIGRVILLLNGYRPDDGEQHKTTFAVAGEMLGDDFADLIQKIQKYRVKRNDCVYEPKGLVGKAETEAIFTTAHEFWRKVKRYLEKKNPQLKLFREF